MSCNNLMNDKMGAFICAVVALALMPGGYLLLGTTPLPMPPRPTSSFPSRPVVPTPPPTLSTSGAGIELRVHAAMAGLWSVVQWQDGLGGWHDVEGWRGGMDDQNRQVWWVAPKDMGTGPFRWLVLDRDGGEILATSEPFYLPAVPGQLLVIEVFLDADDIWR